MNPLEQSLKDHRGSQGVINGDCTYNKPRISNTHSVVNTSVQNERQYTNLSVHVHNQTQQVTLVQKNSKSMSPISFKEQRNSEQRIPGKKTLKDYFPKIKNHSKYHSVEAILETPHHWLQRI